MVPSIINNIIGNTWFIFFIDNHTSITFLFLMKEKSKVDHIFRKFNNMVQTQIQIKIQVLKIDNVKKNILKKVGYAF